MIFVTPEDIGANLRLAHGRPKTNGETLSHYFFVHGRSRFYGQN